MDSDAPEQLRYKAVHFRRLATILTDKMAAAELLEIATSLEAKALKIEADEREKSAEKPGRT